MTLDQLRPLRERQALSIRTLAQIARVSPATVLRGEQGHAIYPVSVRKLAAALGVTPAELRGDAPTASAAPEPPTVVPIDERQAVMVANLLDQAERVKTRGEPERAAQIEQLAAGIAQSAGGEHV